MTQTAKRKSQKSFLFLLYTSAPVSDEARKRNGWSVLVNPERESYPISRPRTSSEGGNLTGEGRVPLSDITYTEYYNGTIYRIYSRPIEIRNNVLPSPVREYYDVNGDGRIDLMKGRRR